MQTESKKTILSDATILLVLNIIASGLNYLYQILAAKQLGVASFGIINGVFSFTTIVAVPGTTLTMVMARRIALFSETEKSNIISSFIKQMTRIVVFLSFAVCIVEVVLYRQLKSFLKLQNSIQVILVILICFLVIFHPYYSGCMSGFKNFWILGCYGLMIPAYKLFGLIVASRIGHNLRLEVCLASIVLGSAITLVVGQLFIKKRTDSKSKANKDVIEYKELITSLFINMGLIAFMNADILAVRYNGDDVTTGLYSAATLFGRIVYYIAVSAGTVLIPYVAGVKKEKANKMLCYVLAVVMGITVFLAIMMNVFGIIGIRVIYGQGYAEASEFLPYVAIISIAMAAISILANYAVGIGKTTGTAYVMSGVTVAIFAIIRMQMHEKQKLLSIGGLGVTVSVILFFIIILQENNKNERVRNE